MKIKFLKMENRESRIYSFLQKFISKEKNKEKTGLIYLKSEEKKDRSDFPRVTEHQLSDLKGCLIIEMVQA